MPRDHGKLSITIIWFHENSWEPTFIAFNVKKQFSGNMLLNILFKLKNITVFYYLQKKLQCLLKCQKKVNLSVNCACTKMSKPESRLLIDPYTRLKCSLQILSFHKRASSSLFNSEIVTKRLHSNCFLNFWSHIFFSALEAITIADVNCKTSFIRKSSVPCNEPWERLRWWMIEKR